MLDWKIAANRCGEVLGWVGELRTVDSERQQRYKTETDI